MKAALLHHLALRCIALLSVFPMGALSAATLSGVSMPVHLRCEYKEAPLDIDTPRPRLSWRVEASERAQSQTAYRILVASAPQNLNAAVGDLWDSGKVASSDSQQIVYGGAALDSRQQVYWKVMLWDREGSPSDWSEPAEWSMGLLESSDWEAEWIGYDAEPALPQTVAKADIVIVKAAYGIPGEPAYQRDVKSELDALLDNGVYDLTVNNELAGDDPAPGKPKKLVLVYSLDGNEREWTLNENAQFNLHTGQQMGGGGKRYLPAPHLRKGFAVERPVERAILYFTAQGFAEMRLNGQRVGDDYFVPPGWTDYRKRIYYKAYDVTDLLKPGENAIAAILGDGWFRGNISILGQNQYGSKLRLLSQLHVTYADGSSRVIASDPSWKASFGPILESDMQAGETYDARLEIPGWDRSGFDATLWAAVDTGSALQAKPLIQAYPGTPVRKTMELPTREVTEPKAGVYVFDLGQNFSGWARLRLSGQAGDRVVMRFGEMLNEDGTLFTANLRSARATDTYILKGGDVEVWEPHFTFHGFRYVEVTGLRTPPTPEMITGVVVHTDAPMTSAFECSDPMLNQLHSNILWGQRSNYLEVPTDCPQRDERLGWTGDTQVFIRSGTYHQDVAAFFTKWMVDLMDTADARGIFGKQAPVFHGRGSPGWSDAGVICPWVIYQVYGDTRILEAHYDAMARYVEACGENGLDGLGRGFGDWLAVGSKTPKALISVAYYGYVTSLMAQIAEVLGKEEDAQSYRVLFDRIRAHFQKRFVDHNGKIEGDTQTGYCMALHYNLLTDAQRKQAADHLVERIQAKNYHLSVGFLGVPILLPTLTEIGRSDLAYRLIQNRSYPSWGYSVEQGATTIWERWNSYTLDNGINSGTMNSFNHYAYGACSEWMFYSMLGIDLAEAGYKTIRMKPEVGYGVDWAKGYYDSIQGRIASDWKLTEDSFAWAVTVPANTTAMLYFPDLEYDGMTVDGRPITEIPEVEYIGKEAGRIVYRIASGRYAFDGKFSR